MDSSEAPDISLASLCISKGSCGHDVAWNGEQVVVNEDDPLPCCSVGYALQTWSLQSPTKRPQPYSLVLQMQGHQEEEEEGEAQRDASRSWRDSILHIGISNSLGHEVFSYERKGVLVEDTTGMPNPWGRKCISLPLLEPGDRTAEDYDMALAEHAVQWEDEIGSDVYSAQGVNCFDFVVNFMNKITALGVSNWKKEHVCESGLNQALRAAWKYEMLCQYTKHRYSVHSSLMSSCSITCVCISCENPLEFEIDDTRDCPFCCNFATWEANFTLQSSNDASHTSKSWCS
eukprot:m.109469 g.109469  ORF g.109469 m.109469 type:complete len:288 (-) comp14003_c0_seq2:407-1270(-)